MAMLQTTTPEAVATLRGLLSAEAESVRATAAKALIELALRGAETADLEERLTRLEELVKRRGPNDRPPDQTIGSTRKANGAGAA
jgi:hypothetical protein